MNYIYIGLLRNSELGLLEPLQEDNYRRIEMGPGDLEADKKRIVNVVKVTFPKPKKDWGLITHFGVWDSLTQGNLLLIGNLIKPEFIGVSQILEFNLRDLMIPIEVIGI